MIKNNTNSDTKEDIKVQLVVMLDDDELKLQLRQLVTQMYEHSRLSKHQARLDAREAADYYHMRSPISPIQGGSRTVAPIVKSKVDDALVELMDIVTKLKDGTKLTPKRMGMSLAPAVEAQILNLVENSMWGQRGTKEIKIALKDALICGTSALRWHVDEEVANEVTIMKSLDEVEFELFKDQMTEDQSYIILKTEQIEGMEDEPDGILYDIQVTKLNKRQVVKYRNIAFDYFFVDPNATSISTANFVCVETIATKADLIDQGYDPCIIENLTSESYYEQQAQVNSNVDFLPNWRLGQNYVDKSMDEVIVRENYVRTALIDGIARLYKVIMVGTEILEVTPEDQIPIAEITPVPNITNFWGVSYAYQLRSQQDVKTALIRGYIDNIHNANHGGMLAVAGQYNKRDLIDNRPRRVVEVQSVGAVSPFPYNPLPAGIDNLMAHIEKDADDISGVSQEMLGRGDSVWNSNVAASTAAANRTKGDLTIKNYAQGIIFGLQVLARGLYSAWSRVVEGLPEISEFNMSFDTEAGRRQKAMDSVQTYQTLAQTPFFTPQLQYELIKGFLINSSQGSLIQFLKPVQQVMQEQQQPKPAERIQLEMIQAQIQNLAAQTKLKLQESDIMADVEASNQNREDLRLKFEMEKSAQELNLKDRHQINEEFKTAMEVTLAEQEHQLKNMVVMLEDKHKDLFSVGDSLR